MKKVKVFGYIKGDAQIMFVDEKRATEAAKIENCELLINEITEAEFQKAIKSKSFIDTALYLKELSEKKKVSASQTATQTAKNGKAKAKPVADTQSNGKAEKQPQKSEFEEIKDMFSVMQQQMSVLKQENENLKQKQNLNFDELTELHNEKQQLISNQGIYLKRRDEFKTAAQQLKNFNDMDEAKSFRLVLHEIDHNEQSIDELFTISHVHSILESINFVNQRNETRIVECNNRIEEINRYF